MQKGLPSKIFLLLILTNTILISDEIQERLDSIILIDDSNRTNMKQRTVIGCDDNLKIAEVKCSKKREGNGSVDGIENLPQSTQIDDELYSKDEEIEKIKRQLNEIMKQLEELKKVKESNQELREELRKITLIKELVKDDKRNDGKTKEIKVLQIYDDHILIEVQEGESLSKYAQKYYGNSSKYQAIKRANPDKIDDSLQIYIGDKLIIPTSISYKYTDTGKKKKDIKNDKKIKIKVEKGVDIFQLAKIYYKDEKQYYRIYNANKNIIGMDLRIKEDMELFIPIIE